MTERSQFSEHVLAELNKEPNSRDIRSRDVYFGRKKETAYYDRELPEKRLPQPSVSPVAKSTARRPTMSLPAVRSRR